MPTRARPRRDSTPLQTRHPPKLSLDPRGTKPPFCTLCAFRTYGMYTYLRAHSRTFRIPLPAPAQLQLNMLSKFSDGDGRR